LALVIFTFLILAILYHGHLRDLSDIGYAAFCFLAWPVLSLIMACFLLLPSVGRVFSRDEKKRDSGRLTSEA
jgi:hypothetical protein